MTRARYMDEVRWVGVKNNSGDICPPFGVMAIVGMEMRGSDVYKHEIIVGDKPSTTFRPSFAINGPTAIPAGGYGKCTRTAGDFWIKYDLTSTPVLGDGYGPKPGDWGLFKGFPGTMAEGVKTFIDPARNALIAAVPNITTILCKAVGSQTVGTITTGDYKIWRGGVVGGEDSGYTTLPDIYIQADLADGDFFLAHLLNGQWVSPKGGGKGKTWHALADEDIDAGTSGNVLLPDTSIGSSGVVTAENWTDDTDIKDGDKIEVYQDPYDDLYYCFKPGGESATEEVTVVVDVRYDTSTHQIQKKTRVVKVHEPASVSDWTLVHQMVDDRFVVNMDYSEHTLAWATKRGYLFELVDEIAPDPIVFEQRTFVVDVADESDELVQYLMTAYVVDPGTSTPDTIDTIDPPCEEA